MSTEQLEILVTLMQDVIPSIFQSFISVLATGLFILLVAMVYMMGMLTKIVRLFLQPFGSKTTV